MPDTSIAPLKIRLIAAAVRGLIWSICVTCRVSCISGEKHLKALGPGCEPRILCFWHNRLVYFAHQLGRNAVRRGARMTVLVSMSKDGEIGAVIGRQIGVEVERGSENRQAISGLRSLCRSVVKDGRSIIIAPDGSKGPVYVAKPGMIAMAKLTGAPLLPMSFWASRYWRLKSWDRLIIPKPFARIALAVGEPIPVSRDCDEAGVEQKRLEVEQAINQLGFEAEKAIAALARSPKQ